MATEVQRFQAICDALKNEATSPQFVGHVGRVIATHVGMLDQYNAGTNQQKARIGLDHLRDYLKGLRKSVDGSAAAAAAVAPVNVEVDTDFVEGA